MDSRRLPLLFAVAALELVLPVQAARAEPRAAPAVAHEEAVRVQEEAVRNAEHVQALERDIRSLQELSRRNAIALEAMRQEVEQARGERNTMTVIAMLLALLLAGGVAVWAWRWCRPVINGLGASGRRQDSRSGGVSKLEAQAPASATPDIDLSMIESTITSTAPRPLALRARKDEGPVTLQQQADFLQSIGHADRAVAGLLYNLARDLEAEDEKRMPAQMSRLHAGAAMPPQLGLDLDLSAPAAESGALAVPMPVSVKG